MSKSEKKMIEEYFYLLPNASIELILSSIPFGADSFFEFVSSIYVSKFVTNQRQAKVLMDAMMSKRKDAFEQKGKNKEKFGKSKSLKKQKGKAYAKVRVEKLYFR